MCNFETELVKSLNIDFEYKTNKYDYKKNNRYSPTPPSSDDRKNHKCYGGLIYDSDFNTDYRGNDNVESVTARRIIADWIFDEQCKKNYEITKKKREYTENQGK